ncbi:MAG: BolA family transcriptional regulator [Coxiellaceae bacterium]|nr:BolA family transcriptional regulator [Coxiellaceae bacterium]|tara:strand:- start:12558 stop:12794 length:237 start_codon:yes stop_codon:yes gene_type:complete
MVTPEQIKAWIEQGLSCEYVAVEGDGHHFDAVVVSEAFQGKRMLECHRLVYDALGDRMRSEIHALSMKTYTPENYPSA